MKRIRQTIKKAKAKNTHGGKRAGAGRPKDPESIRGRVEAAKERIAELAKRGKMPGLTQGVYTTLYIARGEKYLDGHEGVFGQLIHILRRAPDKTKCGLDASGEQKSFLSLNKAILLTRLHKDIQIMFLRPLIRKFVSQYKDHTGVWGDRARELHAAL